MIEGLASIAVFTENRTLWDHAIAMWNIRVPAYIYISDDGPTHKAGPARCGKYSPYWYDQVVFNASVDGVSQETCRDFGHTAYGLAATFNVAETALIQGLDLYAPNLKRLTAAVALHTGLMDAGAADGWPKDPYHQPPLAVARPLLCSGKNLTLGYSATYQVALTGLERAGAADVAAAVNYTRSWVWKLGNPIGQFMYTCVHRCPPAVPTTATLTNPPTRPRAPRTGTKRSRTARSRREASVCMGRDIGRPKPPCPPD